LKPHLITNYLSFLILLVATLYVSYHSPGYDDEFYNVRLHNDVLSNKTIENFLESAAKDPLHPSGSYLISLSLKELLGSWNNVRLVKTLITISLIYICILRLFPTLNSGFINWVAIAVFSPSFMLYGTGLRWGGEFTALYLVLVSLDKFIPSSHKCLFFLLYTITNILLFNLNYLALVLCPLALIYHLHRIYFIEKSDIPFYVVPFTLFNMLTIAYFAHIIFNINQTTQTGTLLRSAIGLTHGIFINWGLFPISYSGFAAFSSVLLLCLLTAMNLHRRLFKSTLFLLIASSILLIFLSGIGIKHRNILPLLPIIFAFLIANTLCIFKARQRLKPLATICLILFVSTNFFGITNILFHRDTVKGSWNLPVQNTLHYLSSKKKPCERVSIYLWDPVLEFHLAQHNYNVYRLTNTKLMRYKLNSGDCNFLLSTTSGSYLNHNFFKFHLNLSSPLKKIGFDKYHEVKKLLGANAPDYYVKIFKLKEHQMKLIAPHFALSQYK